jgi:chemotaxis protein histidine kinase CheA
MASMADTNSPASVTDAAAVVPAPAAEGTAPAPAVESAPAPDAKVEAKVETPSEAPSLLAGADSAKRDGAPEEAKTEAKPEEKPESSEAKAEGDKPPEKKDEPTEAKKPEEAKPDTKEGEKTTEALAEQPPAPPVYDAPKIPEGVSIDNARLSEFDKKLGEYELKGKVDHALMAEVRQMVINEYATEVQRIGEQVQQYQRDVWGRLNEQRIGELKSDPELGGNRIETTLGNAKYVLEQFGGTKEEQAQLLQIMDAGGVSNYRGFIRFLHNIYERTKAPEPITPNPPRGPSGQNQRSWYDKLDGVNAA